MPAVGHARAESAEATTEQTSSVSLVNETLKCQAIIIVHLLVLIVPEMPHILDLNLLGPAVPSGILESCVKAHARAQDRMPCHKAHQAIPQMHGACWAVA